MGKVVHFYPEIAKKEQFNWNLTPVHHSSAVKTSVQTPVQVPDSPALQPEVQQPVEQIGAARAHQLNQQRQGCGQIRV